MAWWNALQKDYLYLGICRLRPDGKADDRYKPDLTGAEERVAQLATDYGVSSAMKIRDVQSRTRHFGDATAADFYKNQVAKLDTTALALGWNNPIYVHQAVREQLQAALTEIGKFLAEARAAGKPYVIHHVNSYDFRYAATDENAAVRRNRSRYTDAVVTWFQKQFRDAAPGFEWLRAKEPSTRRFTWSRDWKLIAAAYDCYHPDGGHAPKANLSPHAWGAAIDINPETNGMHSVYFWDMPKRIVQIMAAHGFYWGGFFKSHDPMHFQYDQAPGARVVSTARRSVCQPGQISGCIERPHYFFPFTEPDAAESPMKYYHLNETQGLGLYVLGQQQNVHGGVHLVPKAGTGASAVRAMTSGYIAAARLIAPNTAGFTELVRKFVAGRDLGFVLVRHEIALEKDQPKKKAKKKEGDRPEELKGALPLYTLYMHLAPPSWDDPADFYAKNVPWFQSLLRFQHGGVVDMDPLSPTVGQTFWSNKKLEESAVSFTVFERGAMAAKRDGKRIALGKPTPEDVKQALDALRRGCVVTFAEPLLQVKSGDVLGDLRVAGAGDAGFLHWELFSPAGGESAVRKLKSEAAKLSIELKVFSETREDNFLEPDELQKLAGLLPEPDKAAVQAALEKKEGDPQYRYGAALKHLYKSEKSFASQGRDDAKTKEQGQYSYPVTLVINIPDVYKNDPDLSKQSCTFDVKFARRANPDDEKGTPVGKAGKIVIPKLQDGRFEFVVQVPATADYMHLSGENMIFEPIALDALPAVDKQRASTAAFCAHTIAYRFRNTILDHLNEWRPAGLDKLLDKLNETPSRRAFIAEPLKAVDLRLAELKKKLLPLTWWARKRTGADPFGEVAVLGPSGKEVSLFGSGKEQLPADAKLDNLHPVTGLWLLDVLEDAKVIRVRESWPHAFILRDEDPAAPRLAGWLFPGEKPALGATGFAVVIQQGYGSADAVRLRARRSSSGQLLELGGSPFKDGVALGRVRLSMWGKWQLEAQRVVAGKTSALKPKELDPKEIDIPKPELGQRAFVLAQAPLVRGRALTCQTTVRFKAGCPSALQGLIYFRYWVLKDKEKLRAGDQGTVAKAGLLVTAASPRKRCGALIIEDGFIVGKSGSRNCRVAGGITWTELTQPPNRPKVFEGDPAAFRFSYDLSQQLGLLSAKCGRLTVLRVRADGLAVTVQPRPSSAARLKSVAATAKRILDANTTTSTELEQGVELVYNPQARQAGTLALSFAPGAVLHSVLEQAAPAADQVVLVKPGFLAPNGGHAVLKANERDDRSGTFHVGIDEVNRRCKDDVLELQADVFLPPLRMLSFGPAIKATMGKQELVTCIELVGDARAWRQAAPYLEMSGGSGQPLRGGTIEHGVLSARWPLRSRSGALWGKTLTVSVHLRRPERLSVLPAQPPSLTYEVKSKLVSFTAKLAGGRVRLDGQAHAMPLDVRFKIVCERQSDAGAWTRDEAVEGQLVYASTSRQGHAVCAPDGSFGAEIDGSELAAGQKWRFTWRTVPAERVVQESKIEGKQATLSVNDGGTPASNTGSESSHE